MESCYYVLGTVDKGHEGVPLKWVGIDENSGGYPFETSWLGSALILSDQQRLRIFGKGASKYLGDKAVWMFSLGVSFVEVVDEP